MIQAYKYKKNTKIRKAVHTRCKDEYKCNGWISLYNITNTQALITFIGIIIWSQENRLYSTRDFFISAIVSLQETDKRQRGETLLYRVRGWWFGIYSLCTACLKSGFVFICIPEPFKNQRSKQADRYTQRKFIISASLKQTPIQNKKTNPLL